MTLLHFLILFSCANQRKSNLESRIKPKSVSLAADWPVKYEWGIVLPVTTAKEEYLYDLLTCVSVK